MGQSESHQNQLKKSSKADSEKSESINWYSCHKPSDAGNCHTFLVSLSIPFSRILFIKLLKQRCSLKLHLFSKTGLQPTLLAKELLVLRSSLMYNFLCRR